MEINQNPVPTPTTNSTILSTEEILKEIYDNTRKTKNYMKWQLYITIILIVIPLLAAIFIVPFAFNSLSSSYGGLLQ